MNIKNVGKLNTTKQRPLQGNGMAAISKMKIVMLLRLQNFLNWIAFCIIKISGISFWTTPFTDLPKKGGFCQKEKPSVYYLATLISTLFNQDLVAIS